MPRPNPKRDAGRCVYALKVDDRPEHVLALAPALAALLGAGGARLVPCPSCSSTSATLARDEFGRSLPRDLVRCGACGHRWAAPDERPRVSAEWRRRMALAAAAARAALPRALLRGDSLYLRAEDLPGWSRIGIADALLGRRPAHLPDAGAPAWVHAYAWGWTATLAGLLQKMTDTPTPPTTTPRSRIPVRVAQGMLRAQAAAHSLTRDANNKQIGYDYTTADQVSEACRRLLTTEGLFFTKLNTRPVPRSHDLDGQLDIGNQYYSADVEITYAIVHAESGDMMIETSTWPIIVARARPHDKAMAATVTYATGQILMGLLCLDREDRNDRERNVDSRTEDVDSPPREPRESRTRKPAAAAKPKGRAKPKASEPEVEPQQARPDERELAPFVKDPEQLARITNAVQEVAKRTGRNSRELFSSALAYLGIPPTFEHDGKTYTVDRPRYLRQDQARDLMTYLEDLEGDAAGVVPGDLPTHSTPEQDREYRDLMDALESGEDTRAP
jgi:hypothetical protein